MKTCIHCGREEVGAWLETAQGIVCNPCYRHKQLHEAIWEHRELHAGVKPGLIPLDEPDDPPAPVTMRREHTVDGVVFEETEESRRATQRDWFLGIAPFGEREPYVCHGTVTLGPVLILRPVRVEGPQDRA